QGLGVPDGGAPVQLRSSGDEDATAEWLPINARGTLPSMPDMAGRGGPPPVAGAAPEASAPAPAPAQGPPADDGGASRSASAQVEQISPGTDQSWWSKMSSLLALLLALLAALYGYKNRGWIGPAVMTGMLRMRLGMTAMAAVLLALPMRMRLAPAALAALLLTLPGRLRLAPAAVVAAVVTLSTRVRLAVASLLAALVAILVLLPSLWRK
ncbi:MAG TPA: hypothetical protein VH257_18515, partial [Chloroflexota bacterium]|nr:hypothetical protein [Chloroflexota bacterium]